MDSRFDAIVIGGGPAGSATAAVLAEKGRRVIVLEREKFPRYHIGESLIPYTYFPLQRIGMIEKMKASHFPKKFSVSKFAAVPEPLSHGKPLSESEPNRALPIQADPPSRVL